MNVLEGYVEGMISGGGGGGSEVSIEPTLTTGTKIADFTIDEETGSLYAPTPIVNDITKIKIACFGLAGETVTLTDSQSNETTKNVVVDYEVITFDIVKPDTYILTNSKNQSTQTFVINVVECVEGVFTNIIPTLTDSNIGDNGTAIAPESSPNYEWGHGYLAFDNNLSTRLAYQGENQTNAYIGYVFNDNVYIDNVHAFMGNYQSWNDYLTNLQITYDGESWVNVSEFYVGGTNDGNYEEYVINVKKICRGFRLISPTEKVSDSNWFAYEIICNGYEFNNEE